MLADPLFTVDPVPRPPFALTVAWLRGAVGRFSPRASCTTSAGPRAWRCWPGWIRTHCAPRRSGSRRRTPVPAELVPVRVLAVALGVRAEDGARAVEAVAMIAPAYLPGAGRGGCRGGRRGPGTALAPAGRSRLRSAWPYWRGCSPRRTARRPGWSAARWPPSRCRARWRSCWSRRCASTLRSGAAPYGSRGGEERGPRRGGGQPGSGGVRRSGPLPGGTRAEASDVRVGPRSCPAQRIALALAAGAVEAGPDDVRTDRAVDGIELPARAASRAEAVRSWRSAADR